MSLALVHLPYLDLVRGFVAVGRRMSITQAAADLCLTQSAVSRQIHALERQLGVRLLVRGYRSIAFTDEGERLFRTADVAVEQLQQVLGAIKVQGRTRPVTISASIGITALWLLPRLSRLQKRHPGLDVRVAANNKLADLRNDGIDLAIRYTSAAQAPARSIRLFGETVAPVAHPSVVARPWRSAQSLAKATLLEFDEPRYAWLRWSGWLEAQGWHAAKPRGILRFNQYDLTVQAALAGQGVALGRLELIRPLLDSGQLVLAGAQLEQTSRNAYWLLAADESPRPEVRRVAEWIQAEAEQVDA